MRLSFLLLLIATVCTPLHAESIDSLFAKVPQKILPLLELNPRLDMLDLYNYDMTATGENIFGGHSLMLLKTENHIRLQLTAVSEWEIMRLQTDDNEVIYACIHSLNAPTKQSCLTLYDEKWNSIAGIAIPTKQIADFWASTDTLTSARRAELQSKLSPYAVAMQWNDEGSSPTPRLTLTLSTANLCREDRDVANRFLKPLYYIWNGNSFEEEKSEEMSKGERQEKS